MENYLFGITIGLIATVCSAQTQRESSAVARYELTNTPLTRNSTRVDSDCTSPISNNSARR